MMRFFIVLFFLVNHVVIGQKCDTLYSHERYVERYIDVELQDCYYLFADTIFSIVRRTNHNSEKQERYFFKNDCYVMYHSITGDLIKEYWDSGDTSFSKTYFPSGQLKEYKENYFKKKPHTSSSIVIKYFNNGQVRSLEKRNSKSLSESITYFKNGRIRSKGKLFNSNYSYWGDYIEYYPNGAISLKRKYSLPDTNNLQYQESEILEEIHYDTLGNEIVKNRNSQQNFSNIEYLHINIYPKVKDIPLSIPGDSITYYNEVDSSRYYDHDMKVFKDSIINQVKAIEGKCNNGVARVTFLVNREGKVGIIDIVSNNDDLTDKISMYINTSLRWPPGMKDGEKVFTYVDIYLILNSN